MTTQHNIQRITGITADDYSKYVYELGLKYALHYTNGDEQGVDWMTATKSFWAWWKNQFENVDNRFLQVAATFEPVNTLDNHQRMHRKKTLRTLWLAMHKPEVMEFFPGKNVMEETYTLMLHQASKEAYAKRVPSKQEKYRMF